MRSRFVERMTRPVGWEIQHEPPIGDGNDYHLLGTIEEDDESFVLEASWAQCLYTLFVYPGKEPKGDPIVALCMFADDDPSKFAHQLMRMTAFDTGNRLRKINSRLKDVFVISSELRERVGW